MKNLIIKTISLFVLIVVLMPSNLFAQPFRVEGNFGAGWSNYNLTDRGNVGAVRILASTTNSTNQFLYNNSSGNYNPRYSTDNWATAGTLVLMSFVSGTNYSGTIPNQSTGTTVSYYILTSNNNTFAVADADYFSLEIDNNSGSNYSYTVIDPPATTAQDGDWNTATTWTAGSVPSADAKTQINHAVTINGTVVNNPATIEITAGNSITFGASGEITANTSITNDGTIDMTSGGLLTFANNATFTNNSTFTGGTGDVVFSGVGTVSGAITFNNIEVKGAVDLGGSASLDGTLTINGGNLNNNSITYNSTSTLKYAANYNVSSGDKSWYSNIGSSGSAQEGIPWNVEVPVGVLVQLNDSYPFSINGNILIDGSFRLGTDGGTHWGNFYLRGNFTNNGTFTHNDRETVFNGTSAQTLTGATTFAYFKMDGSGGLTLNNDITIMKTLNFSNGKITIADNNITIDATAGTISGGNSSSYAITNGIGYLIQDVGNSEKTFPVGTTTNYTPAFLTQEGMQEDLYVRVKQGIDNATNDDEFTVNLQWTIDEETAGSNNITTKFQWNSGDENTFFDNEGTVHIGRYSGSYTADDATIAGSNPYTASASGMIDDISAEIPFIVGNTIAFAANGYRTTQNGNWNTGTTWLGGIVPPANAICMILHHITVNSTLNNADEVNIYENKSVTFQASGDLTVNGIFTNHGMLKTENATASITINGTLKNTSTASVNMVGAGTLSFLNNGIFTNDGSFTAGTGTVDFQGDGTLNVNQDIIFNNLDVAGNIVINTNDIAINGVLTLNTNGTFSTKSIKYLTGSTLKFNRDFDLADDRFWFRATANSGSAQIGIPWNVDVLAGKTVKYTSSNDSRAINGDLTITGTFELGDATNAGDFYLSGNFTNNGTFTHKNKKVEFNGNTNQKIDGTGSGNFYDLDINNSANITLKKNTETDNNLVFTNGKIILGNNNLTIQGSISGAGTSKYIVTNGTGYLIQEAGTSETTFPVGTLTGYNPAYLTETTAEDYSVRVQNSIDNIVDDPTQVVNIQWTIDNVAFNTDNVTIKLQWNSSDEASNFTAGTDEIAYYSGGSYNHSAAITSGLTASRTIASSVANTPISFIIAENTAFSGGIYTIADGNWNTTGTWNGGVIPGTGQCAVIQHNVTLDVNPTIKAISISSTGNLDCNLQTITLDNGGAISNSGIFNANGGKIIFSGTGSISSGSITFNNVDLNGAVSFGSNTTINGVLSLNAGGSINTNAPVYGATSTLKYNQGGAIARASEWQYNINEGDPGYPANVQISNSTTLDVDADNNDNNYYNTRFLSGDLTIDELSTLTLGDMGGGVQEFQICGVYAKGNINNAGTITLSSNNGGDMMLEGDITNSGTINWNSRAIFFTGDNNINQNVTGLSTIPFILITRGANIILHNDITVNGSGTEFITFARPSSTNTGSIDLNGKTLTCSGNGNIELNNITGAEVTSSVANGRIEVSGGNATYSGIGSGTLNFGTTSSTDVTLAINGGTMTFPSTLGIVSVYGTLEIGDGATITNIPTYGNNSTLHYKKGGSYTMGVEWGAGSNVADNIPTNVTISQGGSAAVLNMNANRHALGELLIENNATLEVAEATGQLTVNNLTVNTDGTIVLKSPNDNGVAGSLITYGTVTNNGTMQAERYISGGKYTYVSPPNMVTNSQLFTNNSNGHFNPNFFYYNQAFNANPDPDNELYSEWKENNYDDAWIYAHDDDYNGTGIVLDVVGRGYAYYNDINKKFIFDGTFTTGDKNITVTYDANDANNGYFDGWNLIANPYPSALDWDNASWDKTYVDAAIYYWDGTSSNEGNYKYYVSSGNYDDGTDVVNGGSKTIPASQAFFVKAKVTAGSGGHAFTIPNDARVHNTQDFWGKSDTKSGNSQFIRLQATANNATDELVVRYITEGTINFDGQYDAYKMYSMDANTPQIYSYNDNLGAGFAINSLPINEMQNAIPIGVEIRKTGISSCTIELTEFSIDNQHIYFEDTENAIIQNLSTNPVYSYTIDDSSDVRNRFYVFYEENIAPIISNNIPDYTINYLDTVNYNIPENTFSDANNGDILSYTASLSNGELLPNWLKFNASTGAFVGIPENAGEFIITVTATDIFGQEISDNFIISVNAILAQVSTNEISNIFSDRALVSNTLFHSGGINIEEVGVCWNISQNPTLSDNFTSAVLNDSLFEVQIENLLPNTAYFVRSYAINAIGTQYGNELFFTTTPASIDDIQAEDIYLYPNPASDVVYVSSKNEILSIKIFNVTGKTMLVNSSSLNNNDLKLNIENLSQGIYFIEIETSLEIETLKIIIK